MNQHTSLLKKMIHRNSLDLSMARQGGDQAESKAQSVLKKVIDDIEALKTTLQALPLALLFNMTTETTVQAVTENLIVLIAVLETHLLKQQE
jgi:predicted translin family RNA/ssDNA-binding protein